MELRNRRLPKQPAPAQTVSAEERISVHNRYVHTEVRPSPFSVESEVQNYHGFIHLALLLLFVNALRLIVENFLKYGIIIQPPWRYIPAADYGFLTLCFTSMIINILLAYAAEYAASYSWLGAMFVFVNTIAILTIPPYIVWTRMYHPGVGTLALFVTTIYALKLISYHAFHAESRHQNGGGIPSLAKLVYFLAAPTLCYQEDYPRSDRIRKSFVIARISELISSAVAIFILVEQYAKPTVMNSLPALSSQDWAVIIERILKLSLVNLAIWLLGFYFIFHSFLNLTAELLRFGDRAFYHAWWNANSVGEYWRLWNAPVHLWLKRHVYWPLINRWNFSPKAALIVIFMLSALFHEYIIAIPTHVFRGWAFLAMLAQVPLISLTRAYLHFRPHSQAGNYFFWVTLCIVGQPMMVMMYCHAWFQQAQQALSVQ